GGGWVGAGGGWDAPGNAYQPNTHPPAPQRRNVKKKKKIENSIDFKREKIAQMNNFKTKKR
ncbi:hypothetical protein ACNIRR_26630, partial [Escherichia coli]